VRGLLDKWITALSEDFLGRKYHGSFRQNVRAVRAVGRDVSRETMTKRERLIGTLKRKEKAKASVDLVVNRPKLNT